MDEAVTKLSADSGLLTRVLGLRQGKRYESLRLVFERGQLVIACDANTDEIIVTVDPASRTGEDLDDLADDPALTLLLGKIIDSTWMLTNDRGYTDGFQIRCLDLKTRDESCCQFEVAAAAIDANLVG